MLHPIRTWLGVVALLATSMLPVAHSAEVRTTFPVRLEVGNLCTIGKVADVDFGAVLPTGSPVTHAATGALSVRCTLHTPYTIRLDGGLHGTVTDRRMRNAGGQTIAYSLHSGTTGQCGTWGPQWGNGSAGTCIFSSTNHGSEQIISVAGQTTLTTAERGNYSDTVTATITY